MFAKVFKNFKFQVGCNYNIYKYESYINGASCNKYVSLFMLTTTWENSSSCIVQS